MDAPEDRSKALNEHMSSGFAPRADIVAACRHVRFVPRAAVTRCSKLTGYSISRKAQQEVKPRSERTLTVHLWTFIANSLLGLLLRHIGKFNKLTSVCERNPGISHARIIFALLRVVCFLCKHRTLSGRFPCRVAFGSHLIAFPCGAPRTLSMLTIVAAKARLTSCCWNQFIASRFLSSSSYTRFASAAFGASGVALPTCLSQNPHHFSPR